MHSRLSRKTGEGKFLDLTHFSKKGIIIIGCGKMGSALLSGWIDSGIDLQNITVIEPNPSSWLQKKNVRLNKELPKKPVLVLIRSEEHTSELQSR